MCGLVEPEECGQWAGEDGGLWGRGAGVLLDVGPFRWGSRLQAHLGLSLSICYPCFVTSDHKHSGSKHACFLSHSFCGQFSAWGLSRMSSIWAVISSENQEPLPRPCGHWQNASLYGCRREVPVPWRAASWEPVSFSPRGPLHRKFAPWHSSSW